MTDPTERPADHYRRLAEAFTDTVRVVPNDRWDSPSPCVEWSARGVLNHIVTS